MKSLYPQNYRDQAITLGSPFLYTQDICKNFKWSKEEREGGTRKEVQQRVHILQGEKKTIHKAKLRGYKPTKHYNYI